MEIKKKRLQSKYTLQPNGHKKIIRRLQTSRPYISISFPKCTINIHHFTFYVNTLIRKSNMYIPLFRLVSLFINLTIKQERER